LGKFLGSLERLFLVVREKLDSVVEERIEEGGRRKCRPLIESKYKRRRKETAARGGCVVKESTKMKWV
jgi:hypothetical protein